MSSMDFKIRSIREKEKKERKRKKERKKKRKRKKERANSDTFPNYWISRGRSELKLDLRVQRQETDWFKTDSNLNRSAELRFVKYFLQTIDQSVGMGKMRLEKAGYENTTIDCQPV